MLMLTLNVCQSQSNFEIEHWIVSSNLTGTSHVVVVSVVVSVWEEKWQWPRHSRAKAMLVA